VKLETPCSGAPRRTIRDWEDSMSKTEDEMAIRQLAAAYADACNRMNPVDMAAVYAEDGELVALQFSEKPMKGREKLQRIFANLISERDFTMRYRRKISISMRRRSFRSPPFLDRWPAEEKAIPGRPRPRFGL
jgi:hypothetical protein